MISDRDSLPPTSERVAAHSDPELNRRIRRRTESTIAYYAGHPEEIDARLGDLTVNGTSSGYSRPMLRPFLWLA